MIVVTHGADERVRAVLSRPGKPMAFPDEDSLDLAVVDVDAGGPEAVLAGFRMGGLAVIEHFACRPCRCSVQRSRRLLQEFLGEVRRRGWGRVAVAALDPTQRRYAMLRRLCVRLGAVPLRSGRSPGREWMKFSVEDWA